MIKGCKSKQGDVGTRTKSTKGSTEVQSVNGDGAKIKDGECEAIWRGAGW